MKKLIAICTTFVIFVCNFQYCFAQCSVCTKTAEQLGEKPGQGLNAGILYLMIIPLALAGIIGFRWWSKERHQLSKQ